MPDSMIAAVLDAEEQARRQIDAARQQAQQMIAQAEAEGQQLVAQRRAAAQKACAALMERAEREAANAVLILRHRTERRCNDLRADALTRMEAVADWIVERMIPDGHCENETPRAGGSAAQSG